MSNEITTLVEAMNANNALRQDTPYAGYEITETRRKYHLLNSVLTNGQRSGLFLIDVNTNEVYKSVAYGKVGKKVGTVASLLTVYQTATTSTRLMRRAEQLGREAFANGLKCVPVHDPNFTSFLKDASSEVSTLVLLNGWHRGWAEANVAAPVEGVNEEPYF